MVNKSLILISLFSILACSGGESSPAPNVNTKYSIADKVITKEDAEVLINEYEKANVVANSDYARTNMLWKSEKLLPRISTLFEGKRGLIIEKNLSSDVSLLILPNLPKEFIDDIDKNLKGIETRLAVLRPSFWHLVANTQKLGLKVGFMSSSSKIGALGVYFNSLKTIGLSSVAEENTLTHELRHHQQYKTLSPSSKVLEISESCLRAASTAFGEIDATEIELSSYLGLENYMDRWLPLAGTSDWVIGLGSTAMSTAPALLTINLEYPVTVTRKVINEESCSSELKKVMMDLNQYFDQSRTEIINTLDDVSSVVIRTNAYKKLEKQYECDHQSSSPCELNRKRIQEAAESYAGKKQIFRDRLMQEITMRRPQITDFLKNLSSDLNQDLCMGAIGYSNFIKCEEVKK